MSVLFTLGPMMPQQECYSIPGRTSWLLLVISALTRSWASKKSTSQFSTKRISQWKRRTMQMLPSLILWMSKRQAPHTHTRTTHSDSQHKVQRTCLQMWRLSLWHSNVHSLCVSLDDNLMKMLWNKHHKESLLLLLWDALPFHAFLCLLFVRRHMSTCHN